MRISDWSSDVCSSDLVKETDAFSAECGRSGGPHRYASGGKRLMRFSNAMLTEMKYGGRQHRAGMPLHHALDQMVQRADAAAGDHRDRNRIGNGAGEGKVIARLGPVAVHGSDEHFASAQFRQPDGMVQRIAAGGFAPPRGEDSPAELGRGHA